MSINEYLNAVSIGFLIGVPLGTLIAEVTVKVIDHQRPHRHQR